MDYISVRVEKPVHSKINQLGSCGMSKSQVIEKLIDFFEKCKENAQEQFIGKNKKRTCSVGAEQIQVEGVFNNEYEEQT